MNLSSPEFDHRMQNVRRHNETKGSGLYILHLENSVLDQYASFFFDLLNFVAKLTRNLPNVYIATASGIQEIELNAQTNIFQPKVSNCQWQWAGCIMADVCMKFH